MQTDLLNMIEGNDANQCINFGENLGLLVQSIEKMLGRKLRAFRIDARGIGWDIQNPFYEKVPVEPKDSETKNP
jgi:hypothetical protein